MKLVSESVGARYYHALRSRSINYNTLSTNKKAQAKPRKKSFVCNAAAQIALDPYTGWRESVITLHKHLSSDKVNVCSRSPGESAAYVADVASEYKEYALMKN